MVIWRCQEPTLLRAMYTEFILLGILPFVPCSGLSSGLASAVTTPVYLTTSSSQAQSSSILVIPTTRVLARNSSSVVFSSISSSTASPPLVARDNGDSDAALLAAIDSWASAFNNTDYLPLADTINQAIVLASIADSCDSNGTTTDPPPTDPNTSPTVPNPPPKKKRNPWQGFLDWLKRQGIHVEPDGDNGIRIIIDRPL
ncbi:54bf251b-5a09-4e19-a289-daad16ccaca6 [Sclerotinia trifoliorum]|uniref:54bf251b-5a09-4e19-a289-daad16ccaca6 n=1 Tax=Sclerotinia trifoliorum TaxID=28548 RepID=A0A8H2ZSL4_9HELO|nr:54bf251b-5a09-4e19-a289-daad16ccaca6 [Sclerotinia trifoliorum]